MTAIDLTPVGVSSPVIITDLAQLPKRPLREIGPEVLTPLEGRTYVYCQMVPDLTDASTDDINQKRRVPHLNAKGEPYVKRFVEKTNGIP